MPHASKKKHSAKRRKKEEAVDSADDESSDWGNDAREYSTDDDYWDPSSITPSSEPPKKPQARARCWCFTINNAVYGCVDLADHLKSVPGLRYYVFQLEAGNEQGTAHFQGYIQFNGQKASQTVQNQVERHAHWEIARGTPAQNRDYCSKLETRICTCGPHEWGEPIAERQRTDLLHVAVAVINGKSMRQCAAEFPKQTLMYAKHMANLRRIVMVPNLVYPRRSKLFIGPTRCGKTWTALHKPVVEQEPWKPKESIFLMGPTPWFDGYDMEETIVMDEFCGAAQQMSLAQLLNYTDNYRTLLPVKGSMIWHCGKEMIFTTNLHPRLWYDYRNRESQYQALCARFVEVLIWTARGAPTQVLTSRTEVDDFFNDGVKYGFNTTRDPSSFIQAPIRR